MDIHVSHKFAKEFKAPEKDGMKWILRRHSKLYSVEVKGDFLIFVLPFFLIFDFAAWFTYGFAEIREFFANRK